MSINSILFLLVMVGVTVVKNQTQLIEMVAVFLHSILGLLLGYMIPKLLKFDETDCKTPAIEVGTQNTCLDVVLANQYFSPLAALPGSVFSVWYNTSGALLGFLWLRKLTNKQEA